jgi:hypothetical protein
MTPEDVAYTILKIILFLYFSDPKIALSDSMQEKKMLEFWFI